MAYIYKIINNINQKVYIGKTSDTIERRWKQHCNDYQRKTFETRPLYSAMNKYGIENFHIELIEECSINEVNEREIYWIERYNSFKEGYNATKGGDGKFYCDYNLIYNLYKNGYSVKEIAKELKYHEETCAKVLKNFGITVKDIIDRGNNKKSYKVAQLDKDTGLILNIYDSYGKAAIALGKTSDCSGNISRVCNGQRKTAYGYKWKRIL